MYVNRTSQPTGFPQQIVHKYPLLLTIAVLLKYVPSTITTNPNKRLFDIKTVLEITESQF